APPAASPPRREVFAVADAAFAARRKTLRAALAGLAGGSARAEAALRAAGIDPMARGETLSVGDFARLASAMNLADGALTNSRRCDVADAEVGIGTSACADVETGRAVAGGAAPDPADGVGGGHGRG
ncbi:MAG: hypothetical protein LBG60_10625, partial [Bifidobacteriaceae bacterium]|nr:hypothetical protein [Bifidobacteriaceae bacterium]